MMEKYMGYQNDKSILSEIKMCEFVWGSKFYSRVLNQVVWIVLGYPFNLADEEAYCKIRSNLKLCRRGKKEWKIFPYPFRPEDGLSVYFTKTACRPMAYDFSKKKPPKFSADATILQASKQTRK